uniref:Uncharacterized protein n=1 Tax=Nelumbo nucifera TaxID=4432 RepID=A0A822XF76_NELNU|nr:TPA_asm: hypothetical protein HUJ06_020014 [Nelumbo nucifera]
MPKILALMAVQRQTAASRLARPWMRLQHGRYGGVPTTTLTKLSTLAHTPSFKASLGQVPLAAGVGDGVGFGFGFGFGEGQVPQADVRAKNTRLRERKRASDADCLETISGTLKIIFVGGNVVNKGEGSSGMV